jgi:hypothetical protein
LGQLQPFATKPLRHHSDAARDDGAAKRHRILIADLATECLSLDKPQMMRV